MTDPDLDQVRACLASTVTEWGSSRESQWRECPMSEDLAHRQRILPIYQKPSSIDPFSDLDVEPEYFSVGQIVHACLQYLHGYRGDPMAVIAYLNQRDGEHDLGCVAEAERLIRAYVAHYGIRPPRDLGLPDGATVAEVETQFGDNATFAVPMTRRTDLILRMGPRQRIVLMDHKTRGTKVPDGKGRSKSREEYARQLSVSPAILGQVWLAMGHFGLSQPPTMIYNCIVKTKIPSFARVEIQIEPEQIERWLAVAKAEAWERHLAGEHIYAYPDSPARSNWDACYPIFGSACRYAKWCHGTGEMRDRHYYKADDRQP